MFIKIFFIPKSARLIKKMAKLQSEMLRQMDKAKAFEVALMAASIDSFAKHTMTKANEILDAEVKKIEEKRKENKEEEQQ